MSQYLMNDMLGYIRSSFILDKFGGAPKMNKWDIDRERRILAQENPVHVAYHSEMYDGDGTISDAIRWLQNKEFDAPDGVVPNVTVIGYDGEWGVDWREEVPYTSEEILEMQRRVDAWDAAAPQIEDQIIKWRKTVPFMVDKNKDV